MNYSTRSRFRYKMLKQKKRKHSASVRLSARNKRVEKNKTESCETNHACNWINSLPMPVFVTGMDMKIKCINHALRDLFKVGDDGLIGQPLTIFYKDMDITMLNQIDQNLIKNGGIVEDTVAISKESHLKLICEIRKTRMEDTNGQVSGIIGTIQDMTKAQKVKRRIERLMEVQDAIMEVTHAIIDNRDSESFFHLVLEKALSVIEPATHGTIMRIDDHDIFRPVAWNGYKDEHMKSFIIEKEKSFNWKATKGMMKKSVQVDDLQRYIEVDNPPIVVSDHNVIIRSSICSPIFVQGKLYGVMNLDSDEISAFSEVDLELADYMREQLEIALTKRTFYDQALFLSRHDALTGLLNRRYFSEIANSMLESAKSFEEQFCLVVFDLNGLKLINDTYGHQAGDKMIVTFANTLQSAFRESDMLGRYGGDEFVGIFPNCPPEFLENRFKKVLENMENDPMEFRGASVRGSFSFGIASFPEDGENIEKLVSVADKLMYAYKSAWKKRQKTK